MDKKPKKNTAHAIGFEFSFLIGPVYKKTCSIGWTWFVQDIGDYNATTKSVSEPTMWFKTMKAMQTALKSFSDNDTISREEWDIIKNGCSINAKEDPDATPRIPTIPLYNNVHLIGT